MTSRRWLPIAAFLTALACESPAGPPGTVLVRFSLPADAPTPFGALPFTAYTRSESGEEEGCRFLLRPLRREGTFRLPEPTSATEVWIQEPVRETKIGFYGGFDLSPGVREVVVRLTWIQYDVDPNFPFGDPSDEPACPSMGPRLIR